MPINESFATLTPSPQGWERITELREAYSALKALIEKSCPNSREQSVAFTHLETSAMWAIKAVAIYNPETAANY